MKKSISAHPNIPTISREAECIGLNYDPMNSKFILTLRIYHYINGTPVGELNKNVECVADNTKQIPLSEELVMGDYDIFTARLDSGDPMIDMLEDGIDLVDMDGTINTKMNYQS